MGRKKEQLSQDRMCLVGFTALACLLSALWMSHTQAFQLAWFLWLVM